MHILYDVSKLDSRKRRDRLVACEKKERESLAISIEPPSRGHKKKGRGRREISGRKNEERPICLT